MTFLKLIAVAVLAGPLMVARTGLTPDGEKYLAEAKKRITAVEKDIGTIKTDAVKADKAKDDLLASKRFLDNVQVEQPKNVEAAALQKKADGLLAQLKPTLLKTAIGERVANIEELVGIIQGELKNTKRSDADDVKVRDHFDMLRQMVHEVLEAEPANTKALAARDAENKLWQEYRTQREASAGKKGATP